MEEYMIQKVLLVGAGAVGLNVAAQIAEVNKFDFRILAGGERLARYEKSGLFVNDKKLNVPFMPTVGNKESFETFEKNFLGTEVTGWIPDLIIIACKNYNLTDVIHDIEPFVGDKTIILSLLNGITREKILGEVCGGWRIPLVFIIDTDD